MMHHFISVNGLDETLGYESLLLSCVHSIQDCVLRFYHVSREEETSRNACHLIFIGCSRCVHMSTRVHRALLISTFITPRMTS